MADPKTHDGFYLQLAGGIGGYRSTADISGSEVKYSGLMIPTSIMLGGTLFDHLVIGGGTFFDIAPSPKYEVDGAEPAGTADFKQFLIGIGGVLDYYIWSDKGLHFPLFMGWGGLETATDDGAWGSDPTGFVMYFGAGYDFWIGNNVCIGGLFRFVIAPIKLNETKYTTIAPGVLLTFTVH